MLKSSILVTLISLFGSALSFLNQLLLAKSFGASGTVDAFLIATSVPTFAAGMVSAMLSYTIVPRIVSFVGTPEKQTAFIRSMLYVIACIALLFLIGGMTGAQWQLDMFSRKTTIHIDSTMLMMTRVAWVAAGVQILGSYLGAVCNAFEKFMLPSIAGIMPYIGMLMAMLFGAQRYGIIVLPVGLLLGAGVAALFLSWQVRDQWLGKISEPFSWKAILKLFRDSPLIAVSMSCFSAYALVDAYWAPQLGEANLSYLGYSQRILIAVGNLVIVGPSAVLVPHFAKAIAEKRIDDFKRDTFRAVTAVVALALPIAVIGSVFAEPLISLVFLRGAFDEHAVQGVVKVLPIMLVGMVAMLGVVMLFRAMFCIDKILSTAFLGITWCILYFFASLFGVKQYSLSGIAYAYTATWIICFFMCLFLINKYEINEVEIN